jgi:hypothetical protein
MIEGMGRKDIGQFLRHVWISNYGDLKNNDLFTALKEHIEKAAMSSVDFARTCSEECERYIELITANHDVLGNASTYVKTLVDDLGFEVALPLLLSVYSLTDTSDLEKVARWLLVFVTRYTILLNLDSSGLEDTLYSLARDTRTKDKAKRLPNIKNTLIGKAPNDDQIEAIKVTRSIY